MSHAINARRNMSRVILYLVSLLRSYFYLRTAQCTLGHDLDLTAHKIQQLCGRLVFTRLQTLLQLKGLEKFIALLRVEEYIAYWTLLVLT